MTLEIGKFYKLPDGNKGMLVGINQGFCTYSFKVGSILYADAMLAAEKERFE